MTNLEKEALVLFKEYTMLELKAFFGEIREREISKNSYEYEVLEKAIEYYKFYNSKKLK